MKDFSKYGLGFILGTITVFLYIFFTNETSLPLDLIVLVGDSQALAFPNRPYIRKIAYPAHRAREVIPLIETSRIPENRVGRIVVMSGTVNLLMGDTPEQAADAVVDVAKASSKRFPYAQTIVIISPTEQLKIASTHNTGDGIHLNKDGYRIVHNKHPKAFAPAEPSLPQIAQYRIENIFSYN